MWTPGLCHGRGDADWCVLKSNTTALFSIKIFELSAKRSGIDVVDFWHAIRMSAGNSFLWETCGPNVFRGEYHDSFPIDLMCKDTQLGYEMARNAKVHGCM